MVVSDQIDLKFAKDVIDISMVKHVHFDQANISHARNLGIQISSGDVIAFIDDDAVPEPRWSARLADVFTDKTIGVAGGIVRGRNGLSIQWAAIESDSSGGSYPVEYVLDDPTILTASPNRYPALVGTNVAFRRDALIALGGFDTDFEFFLDETDMCLRMNKRGWKTCFVPLAEVQHGFEESEERASNRVPKTLFNLGRSKALFLRKHAKQNDWQRGRQSFDNEQRARLLRYLNLGLLDAFEHKDLMSSLSAGFEQGMSVSMSRNTDLSSKKVEFKNFTPTESSRARGGDSGVSASEGRTCSPGGGVVEARHRYDCLSLVAYYSFS